MIKFLDEENEQNAFVIGFAEGLRHPVVLYPETTPADIPSNLIECVQKKYAQYNAGFYVAKVAILAFVIIGSYLGLPKVFGI